MCSQGNVNHRIHRRVLGLFVFLCLENLTLLIQSEKIKEKGTKNDKVLEKNYDNKWEINNKQRDKPLSESFGFCVYINPF